MTRQFPIDAALRSPEQRTAEQLSANGGSEVAPASLALLGELEASLQTSQQALLARDVARLEESTREQTRLQRSLQVLGSRDAAQGSDPTRYDLAFAAQLRAAQLRALHLGRVQAALLARAQRWLRVVSNLLAGLEASYVAPACHPLAQRPAWPPASSSAIASTSHRDEENDACRA